jgi:hypothetical protein
LCAKEATSQPVVVQGAEIVLRSISNSSSWRTPVVSEAARFCSLYGGLFTSDLRDEASQKK